ncbi:MAG: divalent-cation tolerance protein CutA [Candidatus Thermoplasmatota archaeon]
MRNDEDGDCVYIQVITTIDEKRKADEIAEEMVKKGLAACVQISGPIESTYEWKDQIEKSEEWVCLLKSKKGRYDELEEAIKEIHTYENPEIIAQAVTDGSREYLDWIDGKVG